MSNVHFLSTPKLKMVILHSPYDSLESKPAQDLFGRLIALRLRGYLSEYAYGIMPVDTTDFISPHLAICTEESGQLIPLASVKTVIESKCRRYGVLFSGAQVPESSGAKENVQAVQDLIRQSRETGSLVFYHGGWTIDPEVRKQNGLGKEVRQMIIALHVLFHRTFEKYDLICCGLLRFKTEKLFQTWGYRPLTWRGEELPPFKQASLHGEPVWMHHTRAFSPEILEAAEKYRSYWENRVEIGRTLLDVEQEVPKKAA